MASWMLSCLLVMSQRGLNGSCYFQIVGWRNAFFSLPEDDGAFKWGSPQPSDQEGAWGEALGTSWHQQMCEWINVSVRLLQFKLLTRKEYQEEVTAKAQTHLDILASSPGSVKEISDTLWWFLRCWKIRSLLSRQSDFFSLLQICHPALWHFVGNPLCKSYKGLYISWDVPVTHVAFLPSE